METWGFYVQFPSTAVNPGFLWVHPSVCPELLFLFPMLPGLQSKFLPVFGRLQVKAIITWVEPPSCCQTVVKGGDTLEPINPAWGHSESQSG